MSRRANFPAAAEWTEAALFGALIGVALAVLAGLATFAELWIEAAPIVGPDRILAGSAFVYIVSSLFMYVGVSQASAALVGIQDGSPLAGITAMLHGNGPMTAVVAWLREPAQLCALAAPIGALSAVRSDDDEGTRPWRREAVAVAALSGAVALLTALVFFLLSIEGSIAQGISLEGTALRLVVVPAAGVALSAAARLGEALEHRVQAWLEGASRD